MLANAAAGSSKNIVPNLLMARSNCSGGKRWTWASARWKVTLRSPCAWASSRARSIIGAEWSTPSALPAVALRAACRVVCPAPQPTSRTWSWRRTPQARRSTWLCSRSSVS
jgi:hypothetical protein